MSLTHLSANTNQTITPLRGLPIAYRIIDAPPFTRLYGQLSPWLVPATMLADVGSVMPMRERHLADYLNR